MCEFLANPGEKPWFLYYNIGPPHMPLADMPHRYLGMFPPDPADRRGNVPGGFEPGEDQVATYLWDFRNYLLHLPCARSGQGKGFDDLVALYRGATTWVDDTLGRVLDALDAAGLADDTLIVFTSDHGDLLGSHGLMGKGMLWEESIRVPMLARGPGVRAGHVAAGGVGSLVDVAPTLLAAAGLDVPDHLHGESLLPALGGGGELPDCAMVETAGDGTAIRTPTHLLGLPRDGDGAPLGDVPHKFFDLANDPLQLSNLSPTDADAEAGSLVERLREWDESHAWMKPPVALDR